MAVKNRSARITKNVDFTTADVVERPTASGPPRTLKPSMHPTCTMIVANATLLTSPANTSRNTIALATYRRYIEKVMFVLRYMNTAPARMPKTLLMIVRQGTVIIAATYLGASTISIGSSAM